MSCLSMFWNQQVIKSHKSQTRNQKEQGIQKIVVFRKVTKYSVPVIVIIVYIINIKKPIWCIILRHIILRC